MPAISLCPRCKKPVSLPAGANSSALVRCPLCDAEYELREAIPPKLIPIGIIPTQQPVRMAAPEIHLTHADVRQGDDEENEAVMAARTLIAASRVPKPPAPRSPIKTMVEVVLGGLAGCLVAYYGLAIYFGPQLKARGLPELPLPYIAGLIHPEEKGSAAAEEETTSRPSSTPDRSRPAETAALPPSTAVPKEIAPAEAPSKTRLLRPVPGSREFVGPRFGPSVNSEELAEALRKANAVSITNADDLMPPTLYQSFCQLGSAVTFVNGPAADTELSERIAAARTFLEKVGRSVERLDKIGHLADRRLDEELPQNAGILLAGTVKDIVRRGQLWIATVQLSGQSTMVTVTSPEPMIDVKVDDRLVTLGVVVREPDSNLVGYTGVRPTVVWSGASVRIP